MNMKCVKRCPGREARTWEKTSKRKDVCMHWCLKQPVLVVDAAADVAKRWFSQHHHYSACCCNCYGADWRRRLYWASRHRCQPPQPLIIHSWFTPCGPSARVILRLHSADELSGRRQASQQVLATGAILPYITERAAGDWITLSAFLWRS